MSLPVSIVIPTLDEAPRIAAAVERAWATGPREVIVVDGGSRDGTADIAAAGGAAVIFSPRGRAAQQNRGAAAASGDALLFLHADCWLAPHGLDQVLHTLLDERIVGGAFWQSIEAEGTAYRLLERGNAWRVARWGLPYGDQGIFVRREIFERLGGFPLVPLMEDVRFSRALRRLGRVALLPGPLHVSARRWQRHGILRQTLRNWTLLAAERLGVSPARLAGRYARHNE